MYDGHAVSVALYRRAQKDLHGPLAANLWRYLRQDIIEPRAAENAHRKNLTAWARELRAEGEREMAVIRAEMEARNAARREA